jgi:hypothetical protein
MNNSSQVLSAVNARNSRHHAGAIAAAIIGFVFCAVSFYPGFMSTDSLVQFRIAKTLQFTDWYPPAMSWLWSLLNVIFPGPQGMLYFDLALLWGGLYFVYSWYAQRRHAWLILLVGYLPWVLNFAGVLWKDVSMAGVLLCLCAIALRPPSPSRYMAAALLLLYAVNLRYNALFAAAPLVFVLARRWRPAWSGPKALFATLAAAVASVLIGSFFNTSILNAAPTRPANYIIMDDLFHLSLSEGRSVVPGLSLDDIQSCATRDIGQTKLVGRLFCLDGFSDYALDPPTTHSLTGLWLSTVLHHPFAYFRYRLAAFAYLLRSPAEEPYYIWHAGVDPNDQGITHARNGGTLVVDVMVHGTAAILPFLFKPYWWLWLTCMLLLLCLWRGRQETTRTSMALLLSSLLYVLGYVPLTPMADFRYVYWSVIATNLAGFLLIIDPAPLAARRQRVYAGMLAAIVISLVLFNVHRVFAIDVDTMAARTLTSPEYPISGKTLDVGPVAPGLQLTPVSVDPRQVRFITMRFACRHQHAPQRVHLYWWGDQQTVPTESQSVVFSARKGFNLVSLAGMKEWSQFKEIKGLRLDLIDSDACPKAEISNVAGRG